MDYDLSDFDKGNYVFKFYYTDRDRNRRYEVSTINDAVPFDVAYQMCQKHIREFEDRYLEWFFECEPTKQYIQTKIDQEVKKRDEEWVKFVMDKLYNEDNCNDINDFFNKHLS